MTDRAVRAPRLSASCPAAARRARHLGIVLAEPRALDRHGLREDRARGDRRRARGRDPRPGAAAPAWCRRRSTPRKAKKRSYPMANVPADLGTRSEHEWAKVEGDRARVGITDLRAGAARRRRSSSSCPRWARVDAETTFGVVESVKAVSDLYAPLSGEVARGQRGARQEARSGQPATPTGRLDGRGHAPEPAEDGRADDRRRLPARAQRGGASAQLSALIPCATSRTRPAQQREMLRADRGRRASRICSPAIPPKARLSRPLALPAAMAETDLVRHLRALAGQNADADDLRVLPRRRHLRPRHRRAPSTTWSPRGEFFTAYTPYQPEASQGTLRSIFEYQTMMAELTGHGRRQRVPLRRRLGPGRGGADGAGGDRPSYRRAVRAE